MTVPPPRSAPPAWWPTKPSGRGRSFMLRVLGRDYWPDSSFEPSLRPFAAIVGGSVFYFRTWGSTHHGE